MDKKALELEDVIDCRYAHLLKSEGERQIASFLDKCGVRYIYEAPVVVTHHGKQRIWYPDFLLPDFGLYIEYFGMSGQPEYDRGIEEKMKAYVDAGLQVIQVYPHELKEDWPVNLADKIRDISSYRAESSALRIRGYVARQGH